MRSNPNRVPGAIAAVFAFLLALVPGIAGAQNAQATDQLPVVKPEPTGVIHEPRFVLRAIDFASRTTGDGTNRKNGPHLVFSSGLTGAGWISGGGGYRHWLGQDHAIFESTAAYSWRSYKVADARFEYLKFAGGRVTAGTEIRWQDLTQVNYFGEGNHSLEADRAEYRLTSTNVLGHASYRPSEWLAVDASIGWLRPTLKGPGGTFDRGFPPVLEVFPHDPAFALARQPDFIHDQIAVTGDTRDFRSHPAHGGVYHVALSAFHDKDTSVFTTHRFDAEAAQFMSLTRRAVLALHAAVVTSGTATGHIVPLYLMPMLGGHHSLRAYSDQRFHDRNTLVISVEQRFALLTHMDAIAFYDAGSVAARARDLNLDLTDYGFALSMHSRGATFARVDMAHGREGWKLSFRMSDPFHLSKLRQPTPNFPALR